MLLLNSGDPTPLHTWRLPHDTPTCLRLLLGGGGGTADSPEGVLCLTRRGELLMLSVASSSYEGVRDGKTVLAPRQVRVGVFLRGVRDCLNVGGFEPLPKSPFFFKVCNRDRV